MSDGYAFTQRTRKVLAQARGEAARLRHEYVGTEHLLLGLVCESEGLGISALREIGVEPEQIKRSIEEAVKPGKDGSGWSLFGRAGIFSGNVTHDSAELPYTSRAKKVLECSMMEARDLGDHYVGTLHLVLGMLREEKGIAAQTLNQSDVTLENVRNIALRIHGDPASDDQGLT